MKVWYERDPRNDGVVDSGVVCDVYCALPAL